MYGVVKCEFEVSVPGKLRLRRMKDYKQQPKLTIRACESLVEKRINYLAICHLHERLLCFANLVLHLFSQPFLFLNTPDSMRD